MKKEAIVQVKSEIITNQEEINKYEYHLVMKRFPNGFSEEDSKKRVDMK
ncbi:hypothetical protein [Bacillus thuringiensis]|nr:hypothetical protein [Bacillus thuringiensis]